MVITNRDLGGAMFVPSENNPPRVVDADRMITRQIALPFELRRGQAVGVVVGVDDLAIG